MAEITGEITRDEPALLSEGMIDQIKNTAIISNLEHALLSTKMMNQLFIDGIKDGTFDSEYVDQALENFRQVVNFSHSVQVEYVVGFMFNEANDRILLIFKNRPVWMAGKLNGIGGKIEPGETAHEAMEREFREETGFVSSNGQKPEWIHIGKQQRVALFDKQEGSYSIDIFVCKFKSELCVYPNKDPDWITMWDGETVLDDTREQVINLPLNLEILRRRGVSGLAELVAFAQTALVSPRTILINEAPLYNLP